MKLSIDRLVRRPIRNMEAIDWGEVPEDTPFRLMYGENQQTVDVYKDALISEIARINLYPSGTKQVLRERLAAYNDIPADQIVVTNGSDEALELIAKVFIDEGDGVVIPQPSYPCFTSDSETMGASIQYVDLETDFSLDPAKIVAATTDKTKIVWIANPNNPTGNLLLDAKQIEELAKQLDCLLVIDECYFELSQVTAAPLIAKYPNIVVTRSFSKVFALAGLRLGYIMASPEVVNYLNRLQLSNQVFNVNRFALAAGTAILSDSKFVTEFVETFQEMKTAFERQLATTPLQILPTKTTFCIAKLPASITARELKAQMQQKGILIKDCSIYPGFGEQYIYLGVPQTIYQETVTQAIKEALC